MLHGNVLVIGNSGVGKSTLINAVLGEEVARTGYGNKGTTKELEIFESKSIPFRLIDSVGFEPSFLKEQLAINSVKKWSKDRAKDDINDNDINLIWFCVDGTSSKLFPKTIAALTKAISLWKSVPIVVVITKSYSVPDREKNIEMVNAAFSKQKKFSENLRNVIPVVADTFVLNESAFAAPEGISELIDITNELMPEGIKAAEYDIKHFKLNRKRALAHSTVIGFATSAVGIALLPTKNDSASLVSAETAMLGLLAKYYEIEKSDDLNKLFDQLVKLGGISFAAKSILKYVKKLPYISIAANVLDAFIAGVVVGGLGESTLFAFEQIYLGNKTLADNKWIHDLVDENFRTSYLDKAKEILSKSKDVKGVKDIISLIEKVITVA